MEIYEIGAVGAAVTATTPRADTGQWSTCATGVHVTLADGEEIVVNGQPARGSVEVGGAIDQIRHVYDAPGRIEFELGAPADDGTVIFDFNRATNLPCAYTGLGSCPLPLAENKLPVAVEAGEQIPNGRDQ